jgi:hypothetical protein
VSADDSADQRIADAVHDRHTVDDGGGDEELVLDVYKVVRQLDR